MKEEKYPAFFERFTIWLTEEEAKTGAHPGRCDDDIDSMLQQDDIKVQLDTTDAEDIRKELSEYGAWDKEELSNDEDNRRRILWIACGNVKEENNF